MSKPPSRATSPPVDQKKVTPTKLETGESVIRHEDTSISEPTAEAFASQQKLAAKHTLLATNASQNYQRCYKALQQVETYWAGTKYIITVLDQKAKGVGDPLLYTEEEMESALEAPRAEPSFTSPGWR
jgi:hypothetical protein